MDEKDKRFFKKVLEDLESGDGDKHYGAGGIDQVMRQVIGYFDRMREQLQNADPKERNEILDAFMEAKSEVDGYMKRLQERTGMSQEELISIVQDKESFKPEDWESMQERQNDLKSVVKDITDDSRKRVEEIHQKAGVSPLKKPAEKKKGAKKKPHEKWMKS